MKKKTYLSPSLCCVMCSTMTVMSTSQDISSDKGITYGGVDDEGEQDPESRRMNGKHNIWEEEGEDDEYDSSYH